MTDTRTDLPSRSASVDRVAQALHEHVYTGPWHAAPPQFRKSARDEAAVALSALTLLDLAAEMQRRGAVIAYGIGGGSVSDTTIRVMFAAPQKTTGDEMSDWLQRFADESNRIEGMNAATADEIEAHRTFLRSDATVVDLERFVAAVQPGAVLRRKLGLNVRVGNHIAPPGGPGIEQSLMRGLAELSADSSPYAVHCRYETLHPFTDGNGRSGRVLWLWMMLHLGSRDKATMAMELGFLHSFYYQTLEAFRP